MVTIMKRRSKQPAGLYGGGYQNPDSVKAKKTLGASQPARSRTTTGIQGGGYQKMTAVKSYQTEAVVQPTVRKTTGIQVVGRQKPAAVKSYKKQAVVQPTVRPSPWLHGGTYNKSALKSQKAPQPAIAKPPVRSRALVQQEGHQKTVIGQQTRKNLAPHLHLKKKPEGPTAQFALAEPQKKVNGGDNISKGLQFGLKGAISLAGKVINAYNEYHEQNEVKPASSNGKVKFTVFRTSDIDAAVSKPAMLLRTSTDYIVYKSKFGVIIVSDML